MRIMGKIQAAAQILLLSLLLALPLSLNANSDSLLVLTTTNTVTLRGEITYKSVMQLQKDLETAVTTRGIKQYPIYLVLDSPGGSVDAGLNLIEYARTIPNLHTVTIFSASMAAVTIELLPGKRYSIEAGQVMFHKMKIFIAPGFYSAPELQEMATEMKKFEEQVELRIAKRLGVSVQEFQQFIGLERWFRGREQTDFKIVDEIIQVKCTSALTKERINATVPTPFGDQKVQYSACPLIRAPVSFK